MRFLSRIGRRLSLVYYSDGRGCTSSTVAVAFGGYLKTFIDIPIWFSALALLVICTAFNIWGLRVLSWVNMLFTTVEMCGLLVVIAAGMTHGSLRPLLALAVSGRFPAAAIVFFVYLGFEGIANLTEEVRDPSRDFPRAIFIALVSRSYVLVSLAVIVLATPSELASSEAPLALAIQKTWPGATGVLSAIAIFATANTVLISLIAKFATRVLDGRDGEILSIFGTLLSARRHALDCSDLDACNVDSTRPDRQCKIPGRAVFLRGASCFSCRQSRTYHCALSAAGPFAAIPCAVDDWTDAASSIGGNGLIVSAFDQFRLGDLCRRIWGACFERTCVSDDGSGGVVPSDDTVDGFGR